MVVACAASASLRRRSFFSLMDSVGSTTSTGSLALTSAFFATGFGAAFTTGAGAGAVLITTAAAFFAAGFTSAGAGAGCENLPAIDFTSRVGTGCVAAGFAAVVVGLLVVVVAAAAGLGAGAELFTAGGFAAAAGAFATGLAALFAAGFESDAGAVAGAGLLVVIFTTPKAAPNLGPVDAG